MMELDRGPWDESLSLGWYLRQRMLSVPHRLNGLAQLIEHIASACAEIGEHVAQARPRETQAPGQTKNASGDIIGELDRRADEILIDALSRCGSCAGVVSEERALPEVLPTREAPYLVALDPLDGSSNLGCAIPVGTIFSVRGRLDLDPADPASYLRPGTEQVAAGYVIYGSTQELVLTAGDAVHVFTLGPGRRWRLRDADVTIPTQGRIYSVNEANVARFSAELRAWLEGCKQQGYTQRYVGSMVADVHRTLLKGGVFLYPGDAASPEGKLRLSYEAAPMALLFEAAGGFASDGSGRILDLCPTSIHQRCPVVLGGRSEVMSVERALAGEGGRRWRLSTERAERGGQRIACAFELGGRRVTGHLELSPRGRRHQFLSS